MGNYITKKMDPFMEEEFRKAYKEKVLNETVVFILSDHGFHYGPHMGITHPLFPLSDLLFMKFD